MAVASSKDAFHLPWA